MWIVCVYNSESGEFIVAIAINNIVCCLHQKPLKFARPIFLLFHTNSENEFHAEQKLC